MVTAAVSCIACSCAVFVAEEGAAGSPSLCTRCCRRRLHSFKRRALQASRNTRLVLPAVVSPTHPRLVLPAVVSSAVRIVSITTNAEMCAHRCIYKYLCFDAFILRNICLSMQLLLRRLCASNTIMLSFTTAVNFTLSANINTRFFCIEKRRNHRRGSCSALFCSFSAHHKY